MQIPRVHLHSSQAKHLDQKGPMSSDLYQPSVRSRSNLHVLQVAQLNRVKWDNMHLMYLSSVKEYHGSSSLL